MQAVAAPVLTGQVAEAVPLVFEVSQPVFSPLGTAFMEIAIALISAFFAVRVLNFITRKYTEVHRA